MHSNPESHTAPRRPWWKFGYVWLVISGPAIVVVASFVTLWLALAYPEKLVAEDYYQRGVDINREIAAHQLKSLAPAEQGRNHAATPIPRMH
jgi:hypothetical protein